MLVTGVDLELENGKFHVGGVSYDFKTNLDAILTKPRIKALHEDVRWTDLWSSYSELTSNYAGF